MLCHYLITAPDQCQDCQLNPQNRAKPSVLSYPVDEYRGDPKRGRGVSLYRPDAGGMARAADFKGRTAEAANGGYKDEA